MSQQQPLSQEQEQAADAIVLQVRLMLLHDGPPGSLTVRRDAAGHRRVELEYTTAEPYSARGGPVQMGRSLAQIGTEFHRLD